MSSWDYNPACRAYKPIGRGPFYSWDDRLNELPVTGMKPGLVLQEMQPSKDKKLLVWKIYTPLSWGVAMNRWERTCSMAVSWISLSGAAGGARGVSKSKPAKEDMTTKAEGYKKTLTECSALIKRESVSNFAFGHTCRKGASRIFGAGWDWCRECLDEEHN